MFGIRSKIDIERLTEDNSFLKENIKEKDNLLEHKRKTINDLRLNHARLATKVADLSNRLDEEIAKRKMEQIRLKCLEICATIITSAEIESELNIQQMADNMIDYVLNGTDKPREDDYEDDSDKE